MYDGSVDDIGWFTLDKSANDAKSRGLSTNPMDELCIDSNYTEGCNVKLRWLEGDLIFYRFINR